MKKYFQFNGTINGTTFLLRSLFSIVLSIPLFIVMIAFAAIVGIGGLCVLATCSYDKMCFVANVGDVGAFTTACV